ncbi:hypothetical protein [Catenulispora rubra]|uniref:hypothetical protein n=1 Tax=Catenulispora rubra TaxID=280293 RepID=UPI00189224FD|nr:hypothetical protein [Catenulispora rubra]
MASTTWFTPEGLRHAAAFVVADGAAWRGRLRALLLGPAWQDTAQSVVFGMGLLIYVDSEAVQGAQEAACEQIRAALPHQRAASD